MIENTSKRDPAVHLMGSLSEGTEAYITNMESAGQAQLVNSQQLPREGWSDEILAMGIVRGDNFLCDDLFVNATLPKGWTKQASDHAMGSYLVDERGVRRVSIFYKAAFYDRRADMHALCVGYHLATEAIYGDGEVVLPEVWSVLTDDEKNDFRANLDDYLARAKEYPDTYADRLPRVKQLVALSAT